MLSFRTMGTPSFLRSVVDSCSSMPRIRLNKIFQASLLALVLISIVLGLRNFGYPTTAIQNALQHAAPLSGIASPLIDPLDVTDKDGNATLLEIASSYIKAIMDPGDQTFPRMRCPAVQSERYGYLRRDAANQRIATSGYFFALDLHQNAVILPRLIGSIVEVMRYLGPEACSLSIVEGNSDDGTFEILKTLRQEIEGIGAKYYFASSKLDSHVGDRLEILATLRNLALQPLKDASHPSDMDVIFLNDVVICPEDILELLHQRRLQNADMTCGMDWTYVGQHPTFYDVWVARGMNGDSFFEIPPDGNWNSAWNLFWNNPVAQIGWRSNTPFQVFACWNGATVFKVDILDKVKFRKPGADECYQGEPQLFCKDMWYHGYKKIAVVPSVNLEYSNEAGQKIKELKGYTSALVKPKEEESSIAWEANPPDKVKCMRNYDNQEWVPWNEGL